MNAGSTPKLLGSRTERIECPNCHSVFEAEVEQYEGEPFPRYVADCPTCTYEITESEWEQV
jgi:uncharacterized protein (DUF2225 family)